MVGNKPNYTAIDVFRVFFRIEKSTARAKLVDETCLGEGTVRTILDLLKGKNLLSSDREGHSLTDKGKNISNKISAEIPYIKNLEYSTLYPKDKKCFIIIRGAESQQDYVSLRDISVKNSANGALIFCFEGGLYLAGEKKGKDFKELEERFEFKDKDILILAFADSFFDAERGAIAIASELSRELKRFIDIFDK